jgi:hypothetical protein
MLSLVSHGFSREALVNCRRVQWFRLWEIDFTILKRCETLHDCAENIIRKRIAEATMESNWKLIHV